VLNGDIVFTNGWVKAWISKFEKYDPAYQSPSSSGSSTHSHNHHHHSHNDHEHHEHHDEGGDVWKGSVRHHSRGDCQGHRLKNPTSYLARLLLPSTVSLEDVILSGLSDVVMHEV